MWTLSRGSRFEVTADVAVNDYVEVQSRDTGATMLGIRHYKNSAIDLWQGDITTFVCDAMVNAANTKLAGGGGVDGAIHEAGGPSIMEECNKIGGCPTGQAVSTRAGQLPCQWIIHSVGPVWQGGRSGEQKLLALAYRNSLCEAERLGVRHVAFSSLSTGVYRFPFEEASNIAMKEVKDFLDCEKDPVKKNEVKRITFVLFSLEIYSVFQKALFKAFPEKA